MPVAPGAQPVVLTSVALCTVRLTDMFAEDAAFEEMVDAAIDATTNAHAIAVRHFRMGH
jgi:hypothetical protein